MITIYHNPRCRKSREALALISEQSSEIEIVEYLKEPPTKEELSRIIELLGIKPFELIRKVEPIYKEEFKGKDLNEGEWVDAMVSNPKLIERPIVIQGDKVAIGRPPEKVLSVL